MARLVRGHDGGGGDVLLPLLDQIVQRASSTSAWSCHPAAGELIFHVFGAIAPFERRLIAERTKDGIAAARARGKVPGRQPADLDKVQAAIKLRFAISRAQ